MFLAKIISATDGNFSCQLDRGIDTIPYILGSSSGSAHICHAPSIYPAVAVHSCVFWIYRPDSFLCSGGISTITSLLSSRFHSEILSSPYFSEYQKIVTGSIWPRERILRGSNHLRVSQVQSVILTLFSCIAQLIALVWYLVSYFPMGSTGMAPTPILSIEVPNSSPHYNTGLRFASQLGIRRAASWMQG